MDINSSQRNDGIYENAFYRTAPNYKWVGSTKDYNGVIVFANKEITVKKDDGGTVPVLYVNLNGYGLIRGLLFLYQKNKHLTIGELRRQRTTSLVMLVFQMTGLSITK